MFYYKTTTGTTATSARLHSNKKAINQLLAPINQDLRDLVQRLRGQAAEPRKVKTDC